MQPTLLLTGSTGFLGTQLALQLLHSTNAIILALVRAAGPDQALFRLKQEWWDWPDLRAALGQRIIPLPGDITLPHLGLTEDDYARVIPQVTHILHAAADVRLFAPLDALRAVNVTGTRRVLELARAVQQDHPLTRLGHVSTAYVAGDRSGPVAEEELTDQYGFSSPYERSKYEAELLVRQAAAELPISIFRPGMIVGDSTSGAVKTFNTLYYPLRLYMTGRLRIAPARPDLHVDMTPVDYVADAITRLTFDPRAVGQTFHLTAPQSATPTLAEITHATRDWAREQCQLNLPQPLFLPLPGLMQLAAHPRIAALLKKLAGADLAPLMGLLAYFRKQPVFLRTNTERLLGPYPHRWQDLLPALLAFAVRHSFWHRIPRTVHEQILFRLGSRRKPVVYHDLVPSPNGQPGLVQVTRPAVEICGEVQAAAAAIRALGIQAGECVATMGPNSSRYFTAQIASGLAGTVQVPIYPTTPVAEVEELLHDSQAKLFLVGASEVLQRLAEIQYRGPVVALHTAALPFTNLPALGSRPVYSWAEFLALGSQHKEPLPPVALDAPAAMFYTSGTTGRPKGVVYRHEQLRWLAETLASFYPWHERHRWGSYLSFLPMSHVVEGILAAYSPYYVPAALDIYFLEDFQQLPQALKIARPTIFFSVPRFFEKVRAMFLQNRAAQAYLRLPDGPARRLLRVVLRRGLLRKAGLNGARQILVGSAASPPELLGFFQELGIEAHNAYGLTEAPLVAVNRLGRNRVDTVGELLPETQVRFTPQGEVQVAGPQVASGYYGNGCHHPFPDRWFSTGDLGARSADGYLTLGGRVNDMLITAYGENISPEPIEARLRAIPGIAEALLLGDGRPYCAALLWVEDPAWDLRAIPPLSEAVCAINTGLRKPAQVKSWAVIRGSLTVENGALTGSMKVKRALVARHMAAVIEAVYQNQPHPEILYHHPIGSPDHTA